MTINLNRRSKQQQQQQNFRFLGRRQQQNNNHVVCSLKWLLIVIVFILIVYFRFMWMTTFKLHQIMEYDKQQDEYSIKQQQQKRQQDLNNNTTLSLQNPPPQQQQRKKNNNTIVIPKTSSTISLSFNSTNFLNKNYGENRIHDVSYLENQVITIGFASTLTGCGTDPFTEGAAVLKHSIHLASIRGNKGGKYDYKMYIFYHPNATQCATPLADLGYELLQRDVPVPVSQIQGDTLRERIQTNGCCGEKELIKLEAYTLIQHPIVVHLDLDVLVLQPMDSVFDLMLDTTGSPNLTNVPLMWPNQPLPTQINAVWTKDYNVVAPKRKDKPTQGGILILRPNRTVYNEFVELVRVGDYHVRGGWGGKVGPFYGGMTIQGLIPYYYEYLHPNQGIELNRCVYNQMADNPRDQKTVHNVAQGKCRTGQPDDEDCEDCRNRPLNEIVTVHFTVCQKPWHCLPQKQDIIQMRLCRKLHHEWYVLRSDMEKSWGRNGTGTGTWETEQFLGYCEQKGFRGYQRIATPYGNLGSVS